MTIERTKAFPKNSEFDITLTYKGDAEGDWPRSVALPLKSGWIVSIKKNHLSESLL